MEGRLDAERFVKDYEYSKRWWDAHRENFHDMVLQLLDEGTLRRVAAQARDLCLRFNASRGLIPREYNEVVVRKAYDRLAATLTKFWLLRGVDTYFAAFAGVGAVARGRFGHDVLADVFTPPEKRRPLLPFLRYALGAAGAAGAAPLDAGVLEAAAAAEAARDPEERADWEREETFDIERCFLLFVPQLMPWFARFLEVYDGATEGRPVRDLLPEIARRQRADEADPDNPERMVEKLRQQRESDRATLEEERAKAKEEAKNRPRDAANRGASGLAAAADDAEDDEWAEQFDPIIGSIPLFKESYQREKETKELQKREAVKMEVQFLEKAEEKGREAMTQRWLDNRQEFCARFAALDAGAQRQLLMDSRRMMLTMAKGSYANALLYCPEIDPDRLAGDGGVRTFDLFEASLRDTRALRDDVVERLFAGSAAGSGARGMLSGAGKDLVLITRRFLKLSYVCHVYSTVMQIPFSDVSPAESLLAPLREGGKVPGPDGNAAASSADGESNVVTYADGSRSVNLRGRDIAPLLLGRKCSSALCEMREKNSSKFLVCAACKRADVHVPYCCRECQLYDWKGGHQQVCGKPEAAARYT